MSETTQKILSFIDPPAVTVVDGTTAPDSIGSTLLNHVGEDMGSFLSRPLFIYTDTWTPGQGAAETATIDPWSLFLNNKRVINRLNNYRNLRGNLVIRIMMNGNGFYYGRLLVDYVPLAPLRGISGLDPTVAQNATLASQRMHVYLDPSQSTTTEMRFPFFWFYDSVDITTAEWSNLGRLYIRQLAPLLHANAGTAPVSYTIAAWMEDIQLGTPTVINSASITTQAKMASSEKVGPVSKMASALARVATSLSSVPVIGPWATASSVALSAASSIAKIFGWSRPLDLTPTIAMKPVYNAPFAPTDAEDYSQKLTIDSKNELSVDPRITGYDAGVDELSIAHLTGIESYLTSFPWTAAASDGSLLWNSYVTPILSQTDGTSYYLPACYFAAKPFTQWRGCMKFRFQVVASAYHRGRLLVTWDPCWLSSTEPNVQISRVIDITEEKDFTVCVGWGHPKHFLPQSSIINSPTDYKTTQIVGTSTTANGVISVSVLNDLATPSTTTSDISLLVFISMEDAEFAAPGPLLNMIDSYHVTPQALEGEEGVKPNPNPDSSEMEVKCHEVADDDHSNLVYYGEHIPSLRPLLHRYVVNNSIVYNPTSATTTETWRMYQNDYPLYYGYDTVANSLFTTSTTKHCNYSHLTMLNYLAPAFAAVRGSVRSKYIVRSSANTVVDMVLTRGYSNTGFNYPPTFLLGPGPAANVANYGHDWQAATLGGAEGCAYVNTSKVPLLEAELPFYRPVRFACGYTMDTTKPYATNSSSHRLDITTTGSTAPVIIDRWVAAGEDVSFTWFQGCPPLQGGPNIAA